MARINVTYNSFPVGTPHLPPWFNVTKADLLWGAVTIGRHTSTPITSREAFLFLMSRGALILSGLTETPSGHWRQSDLFASLEVTEKAQYSTLLGLALSKIVAARAFHIPQLIYADRVNGVVRSHGKSNPDLVGRNAMGRWIVWESKGRSSGYDANVITKAKNQAAKIQLIRGTAPLYTIGSLSYFQGAHLAFDVDDPKPNKKVQLKFEEEAFFQSYYEDVMKLISSEQDLKEMKLRGRTYVFRRLFDGFSIGLPVALVTAYRKGNLPEFLAKSKGVEVVEIDGTTIYPDLIAITK